MRLKPIVTQCLLAGIMSLPVGVGAVGLGKLTVQSGLGQPLSAEVDLGSVSREEIASLTAKLADPGAYKQNNIEYPAAAARIRVELATRASGAPYLRITSPQSISDPFLDLLIEVNWSSGRLVRNYTFLLDPPGVVTTQAVEPTLAMQSGTPVGPAATPAPAQAAVPATSAQPTAGAGAPGAAASATATATGTATGASTTVGSAASPSTAAASGGASAVPDSIEVKRGDTLHKIATRTRSPGVSLEQMLVALFRANPNAFERNNMNWLLAGQSLTVPSPETARAIPNGEALREIRVQAADWVAYRDRLATSAPMRDADAPRQSAQGTITTAVEDKGAASAPGSDRLTLSRTEAGAGGPAAARAEELVAKDKAIADMNSRVAELEQTVADLRRALELRSQALSDMQRQAEAVKAAPGAPAAAAVVAAAPGTADAASKAAEAKGPAGAAEAPKEAAPAQPAKAEADKGPAGTRGDAVTAKAAPKAEPRAAEPGFVETLLGDTPGWTIGAAALAVLGGAWALLAARRRREAAKVEETIASTDLGTSTVFGQTGTGLVNTGDASISSEFSREGLGAIDTDEVDPIAEAEVYLAYGRDAQAEEILKDALKKDPNRQEVYVKLLEIHAQHNKPTAFEAVAAELHGVSGGRGEAWEKAIALGRQIDPNNRLYAGAGASAGFAGAAGAGAAALAAGGLDLLTPAPEQSSPAQAKEIGAADDDVAAEPTTVTPLDFSFDRFMASSKTGELPNEELTIPPVDAGLGDTVLGRELAGLPPSAPADAREGAASAPKPAFDFNLNLEDILGDGAPPAPSKPAPRGGELAPLGGELATMELVPTPAKVAAASLADAPSPAMPASSTGLDLDHIDLNFGADQASFDQQAPALDGQWQDAATKLDLAKAYQEMGDIEGAREILQEVLHEGDDQQKQDAQALLSKLLS